MKQMLGALLRLSDNLLSCRMPSSCIQLVNQSVEEPVKRSGNFDGDNQSNKHCLTSYAFNLLDAE